MGNFSVNCTRFLIFVIICIIAVTSDATYYMKKDHSLIKPYAGVTASYKQFYTCVYSYDCHLPRARSVYAHGYG